MRMQKQIMTNKVSKFSKPLILYTMATFGTGHIWGLSRYSERRPSVKHTWVETSRPVFPTRQVLESIPSDSHEVLSPMTIEILGGSGGWIAKLKDAGISMSGETKQEAVRELSYYISDVYDYYAERESNLAPDLLQQFNTLRTYIRKK